MGADQQPGRISTLWRSVARGLRLERGAELVEFAVVLPLLAMVVVGMSDFGAAWVLRDKLSNAARDGARVSVSAPNDTTCVVLSTPCQCQGGSTPCSVQVAASAVVQYLTNAQVKACGMNPSSTAPTVGTGVNTFTWTYKATASPCSATFPFTLTINRAVTLVSSGTTVFCTQVTISYPFTWNFGHVVKLVDPTSQFATTFNIKTTELMPNLD